MKAIMFLCLVILFGIGCRKDYSVKPSPFKVGDKVRLNGVNPSKSFVPHCGDPSMLFYVTNVYLIQDQRFWWYDLKSDDGCILIHADNQQLKRY
jgi:hypothetical protein